MEENPLKKKAIDTIDNLHNGLQIGCIACIAVGFIADIVLILNDPNISTEALAIQCLTGPALAVLGCIICDHLVRALKNSNKKSE